MSLVIFFVNRAAQQGLYLPSVSGGYSAMYPITRSVAFETGMSTFMSGREQRYIKRAGLEGFVLEYRDISKVDVDALDAFFQLVNGSEAPFTFQFGLQPSGQMRQAYSNLAFLDNSISWTRTSEQLYGGSIRFAQVATNGLAAAAASVSPFPYFHNGLLLQNRSTRSHRGFSYISRMRCGKTWPLPLYAAGVPQLPTRQLLSWNWDVTLQNADLAILESHFVACAGSYQSFTFIDPHSGTSYPNVRYASDTLTMRHIGVDQTQTKISLVEYFA